MTSTEARCIKVGEIVQWHEEDKSFPGYDGGIVTARNFEGMEVAWAAYRNSEIQRRWLAYEHCTQITRATVTEVAEYWAYMAS